MKLQNSTSPLDTFVEAMSPSSKKELWIFGYGSLMWNPSFEHDDVVPCYAQGYARRFWQGNYSYRGSPKMPGRVLTLHSDAESRTYGLAFLVRGATKIAACMSHLQCREIDQGYHYQDIDVIPLTGQKSINNQPITAVTCVARPDNPLFLGDAPLMVTAWQIAKAAGLAGPNAEYLLNCAKVVRTHFPEDFDSHLFALERTVRQFLDSEMKQVF